MDLDLTGRDAAILIQALAGVLPRSAHPQRRAELCRKLAAMLRDDPACMANSAYAPALALAGRVQDAAAAWAGYAPPVRPMG